MSVLNNSQHFLCHRDQRFFLGHVFTKQAFEIQFSPLLTDLGVSKDSL
jgi:hypothetical protein